MRTMKHKTTPHELGRIDGRHGNEPRYPNNPDYMTGFVAGTAWLIRDVELNRPTEDSHEGSNETNERFAWAGMPI